MRRSSEDRLPVSFKQAPVSYVDGLESARSAPGLLDDIPGREKRHERLGLRRSASSHGPYCMVAIPEDEASAKPPKRRRRGHAAAAACFVSLALCLVVFTLLALHLFGQWEAVSESGLQRRARQKQIRSSLPPFIALGQRAPQPFLSALLGLCSQWQGTWGGGHRGSGGSALRAAPRGTGTPRSGRWPGTVGALWVPAGGQADAYGAPGGQGSLATYPGFREALLSSQAYISSHDAFDEITPLTLPPGPSSTAAAVAPPAPEAAEAGTTQQQLPATPAAGESAASGGAMEQQSGLQAASGDEQGGGSPTEESGRSGEGAGGVGAAHGQRGARGSNDDPARTASHEQQDSAGTGDKRSGAAGEGLEGRAGVGASGERRGAGVGGQVGGAAERSETTDGTDHFGVPSPVAGGQGPGVAGPGDNNRDGATGDGAAGDGAAQGKLPEDSGHEDPGAEQTGTAAATALRGAAGPAAAESAGGEGGASPQTAGSREAVSARGAAAAATEVSADGEKQGASRAGESQEEAALGSGQADGTGTGSIVGTSMASEALELEKRVTQLVSEDAA